MLSPLLTWFSRHRGQLTCPSVDGQSTRALGNAGELRTRGNCDQGQRQPSLPTSQVGNLEIFSSFPQRVPTSPQWQASNSAVNLKLALLGHSHTPPDSFSTLPPSLSFPGNSSQIPHPGLCVQTKPKLRQRHADNFQGITDCYNDPSY